MKTLPLLAILAAAAIGCQSMHDRDVKSNYYSQWTTVKSDVKSTVKAGEEVFKEMELRDIKSEATVLDGSIDAKKSNDDTVHVTVRRRNESSSEVSITIGTLGDPSLGADLVKQIKNRAEAGPTTKSAS
jgi:hypothetical protein